MSEKFKLALLISAGFASSISWFVLYAVGLLGGWAMAGSLLAIVALNREVFRSIERRVAAQDRE